VEGSCEHGNELLGSIKYGEVLEYLGNWRLLRSMKSVICQYLLYTASNSGTTGKQIVNKLEVVVAYLRKHPGNKIEVFRKKTRKNLSQVSWCSRFEPRTSLM
jgi:hypothetical protein